MDELQVLRVLTNEYNPHWEGMALPKSKAPDFRRRDFYTLWKELDSEKITSIIGPRRVGKTTLLFQLIEHMIKNRNIDPVHIIYASMDNAYLASSAKEPLESIIEVYSRNILKEDYRKIAQKIYVLLDEIQYLEDWEKKLKTWFDYGYNIKFIVSGSSSAMIQKGAGRLVGRIKERIVLPLKFSDIMDFGGKTQEYYELSLALRDALCASIRKGSPAELRKAFGGMSHELVKHENEIERGLSAFMIKGGYPEIQKNHDLAECSSELKDTILSKSILDIIERHRVRRVDIIRYFMSLIAAKSGSRLTYAGISQDIGVERPTVISHIGYLEDVFLVSKSSFYSKRLPVRERKEKKYYLNDVGMRNSMVGMMNESLLKEPVEMGIAAETLVFDHVKRLKFFLNGSQDAEVFYWMCKEGEIDVVLDAGTPIPIEVKFRNSREESRAMPRFMTKYKSPFGIMVTKNTLDLEGKVLQIPLKFFLFMC
ncbi:MAG: ATP-binding protein [Candidatus Aenigmarchaeota archaeon]|nr:ATP-binding protein [Candidatus Aenigmarchaeota archaeon]